MGIAESDVKSLGALILDFPSFYNMSKVFMFFKKKYFGYSSRSRLRHLVSMRKERAL